jgi:Spy/CpxP family protein refolding chaperone
MKKIIISVAVFTIAFITQAQEIPERKTERPPMMERKRHHHGMEFQQLNLTEDQKARFKEQNENFRKKMEELKKNDNITVKEWRNKAEALRKEHKTNTQSILTSDQKAQLEKKKAEGMARHEAMAKSRSEKMKAELGLSDEQSAKMQANREKIGEKMKAIRESTSLSEEQKRENMKLLHKEQKEFMKSILTEDQLKKMKENMHNKPVGERRNPEIKQMI